MSAEEGMEGVWGQETMDAADAKAAIEGNLVPKGRWEGQLVLNDAGEPANRKVMTSDNGTHPMEGQPIYSCHALLDTDEGQKHFFFDACPVVVKASTDSGGSYMRSESQYAAFLYQATKLTGSPFSQVLDKAVKTRFIYDIGIRKATDDYPAKNTLRKILPKED